MNENPGQDNQLRDDESVDDNFETPSHNNRPPIVDENSPDEGEADFDENEHSGETSENAFSKAKNETIELLNAGGNEILMQIANQSQNQRTKDDVESGIHSYKMPQSKLPMFMPEESYKMSKKLTVEKTQVKLNYSFKVIKQLEGMIDYI